jgi:hypothetical protein
MALSQRDFRDDFRVREDFRVDFPVDFDLVDFDFVDFAPLDFARLDFVPLVFFVGFFGTFFPFSRASDSPMAIACLRLFTFPPLPPFPLFSVPFFCLLTALSTSLPLLLEYLRATPASILISAL